MGENILESSETNFMNLPSYVFDVDYVAKITSELSVTVLEKKVKQNYCLTRARMEAIIRCEDLLNQFAERDRKIEKRVSQFTG